MEGRRGHPIADPYLARAVELAARAVADAMPNPPVGAVLVRDGKTLGEGYHHRRGEAHAEVEALRDARARGHDPAGATAYVSLEPCDHTGRTGPCTQALIEARVARVVAGAADPNPKTASGGFARLRAAGIDAVDARDPAALALIERFAFTIAARRPFVTLKMAMSLDGVVTPHGGNTFAVTGAAALAAVRELRIEHDAVMVGAGTVRIDDARLTVRPHFTRRKPYTRVVVCETDSVGPDARIFQAPPDAPPDAYARTVVLAPAGSAARLAALRDRADVVLVGGPDTRTLPLDAALAALFERGIASVLCEGGPTLAGRLLAQRLVQRVTWFVAPRFLRTPDAVAVTAGADLTAAANGWHFDRVERVGDDMMLSGRIDV